MGVEEARKFVQDANDAPEHIWGVIGVDRSVSPVRIIPITIGPTKDGVLEHAKMRIERNDFGVITDLVASPLTYEGGQYVMDVFVNMFPEAPPASVASMLAEVAEEFQSTLAELHEKVLRKEEASDAGVPEALVRFEPFKN